MKEPVVPQPAKVVGEQRKGRDGVKGEREREEGKDDPAGEPPLSPSPTTLRMGTTSARSVASGLQMNGLLSAASIIMFMRADVSV